MGVEVWREGGKGKAYFDILQERRKKRMWGHVGIDVMERDRIKRR